MKSSRRTFLSKSTKLAATAGLTGILPAIAKAGTGIKNSAAEKIVIGLIGARNMGWGIMKHALNQPGVECGAVCDIDDSILDERISEIDKFQGKKPLRYKDFRKLLDNKDIDAVIIGTPDHWHAYIMIMACEAGKDVYVEKPMANSIEECNIMVKAARKYNRVVQVGQQQRSGKHWMKVMQHIKEGEIGQLRKVNIWANFNYGVGRKKVADSSIPAGVDFDMWLGPAPDRSFNESRFHGSWRMFWDYGGGLMTDWGVHLIDMALWAKNVQYMPIGTVAAGGNFSHPDNAHETFDTMSVSWQMKDYVINWEHAAGTQQGPYDRSYGLAFIGNDATLVVNRDGYELFPEIDNGKYRVPAIPEHRSGGENHEQHVQNWLECIKSREDSNCNVENGRLVATYAHAANIALRTNERLTWDEASGNFGGNKTINNLIVPAYRKPWELPKI